MIGQDMALVASMIVSVITAVGTIIPILASTVGNRKAMVEKLNLVIQEVSRLTMHDEHLSVEERIAAGDRYIESGGNGTAREYHHSLVIQYREHLKERGTD
ncbi:MAG: hypothetical protein LBT14_03270 [Treponema sp.]|jgi:hypothetical protein|nr:hypothetical protein [Treponema sp.]